MDDFVRLVVQRLSAFADKGEVAFDELNDLLPSAETSSEQLRRSWLSLAKWAFALLKIVTPSRVSI